MKSLEVLSPVGDINSFYTAIKAGADAVYMGVPKFNARMRAENISLENIAELVKFAHLKGVKVYIVLNTLLSTSEVGQAVSVAGECMKAGVDAFIVQDLGLIYALKKVYPEIILHGSTQLGVHNVNGAVIAKELGLSRVVLSREVTLNDIQEISNNVDIELEVFVQGANCICFSGNCYLSSLKCGASGNRGECKQLCRLPFKLGSKEKSVTGFTLSPRDNCMLGNLKSLIESGVKSFKIEGRLRHSGYVGVATNVYRQAVDKLINSHNSNRFQNVSEIWESDNSKLKISESKSCARLNTNTADDFNQSNLSDLSCEQVSKWTHDLKKVFSRGEYTNGYFDSNNIIDIQNNNHMGELIGKVVACKKFKDMFSVEIKSKKQLHVGDGLKFSNGDTMSSCGVGNINVIDDIQEIFVKNKVDIGSKVYVTLDSEFENSILDMSRYRDLKIKANVVADEKLIVDFESDSSKVRIVGGTVERAKTKVLTQVDISTQLSKVDNSVFKTPQFEIVTNNAFVSKSTLNEIRRSGIEKLIGQIISNYNLENNLTNSINSATNLDISKQNEIFKRANSFNPDSLSFDSDRLAIVNEFTHVGGLVNLYDALILSPTVYSVLTVSKFLETYKKYFSTPLILNLPNIARTEDLKIIDEIIEYCDGNNIILVANNIYALKYAKKFRVWAGHELNITNNFARLSLLDFGVTEIISSIEKWTSRLPATYKLSKVPAYMTLTSCPVKLLYGNTCSKCKYSSDLTYENNLGKFGVRRYKINDCYFELFDNNANEFGIKDLR